MARETYVYEILLRFDPAGLKGAHVKEMERLTEGDEVLLERELPPRALGADERADLLGDQLPAMAAQIVSLEAAATEKAAAITEKDETIAERDAALVERDARIAELEAQLASSQEPAPAAEPAPSARQMSLALLGAGLLDEVEAFVAAQPREVQVSWEKAISFKRDDPMIAAGAAALGMTDEQIDGLFAAALAVPA